MKYRSPFEIEFARQHLAKKKELISLSKLYKKEFPEIIDPNDKIFWNKEYTVNKEVSLDPMTINRLNTAKSFLSNGKGKVLDIGAGRGVLEDLIVNNHIEIYGTDISDISIKRLRKKFGKNFYVQSIYDLKFKNNFFDYIFVLEVLEHIPPSKIFKVLNGIKNILKNGGILIVSVPMNEGLDKSSDNPSGHLRMYTKELIVAELNIAGFSIIESKSLYAFSNFSLIKTVLARVLRREPNNIVIKAHS